MDYYCDYCDKTMISHINVRKKHFDGLGHKIAKADYWSAHKEPILIYHEELKKTSCSRYHVKKYCKFGQFCQYSHYTKEDLQKLLELDAKIRKYRNRTIKFEGEIKKSKTKDSKAIKALKKYCKKRSSTSYKLIPSLYNHHVPNKNVTQDENSWG